MTKYRKTQNESPKSLSCKRSFEISSNGKSNLSRPLATIFVEAKINYQLNLGANFFVYSHLPLRKWLAVCKF